METKYICTFCDKFFSSKSSLVVHQKTAKYCLELQGKKDVLFNCDFCKKGFTLKQIYQDHLLICKHKNIIKLNQKEEQLETYKKEKEEQLETYKKENRELLLTIKEKDIILKEKENQIKELKSMLEKSNEMIAEIARQPKTMTTNTSNRNDNRVTNKVMFDINDIDKIGKLLDKHLTPEVLVKGQEGLAEMLKEHILQADTGKLLYECTDVARQKFEFINTDGNIETDPKAIKLIRNLGRSGIYNKTHNTGKKLWEKEDGTINYESQEVHMPRVMEALEIDKDSSKLRSRLAVITVRQKT
jgi:hypothetical protein